MDRTRMEMSNLTGGLVLRGVAAILFGIAAVFWPGITILTLLYLISVFLLIGGLFELVHGVSRLGHGHDDGSALMRVLTPLLGLAEIGVGVYLLRHPHVAFTTFILLIGFILIVRGVIEVVEGVFEVGSGAYRTVMVIVGILAVVAGILVLSQPRAAGVAFVWILGVYAIVAGGLLLAAASDVHQRHQAMLRDAERVHAPATAKR